ncbi:MAG: phosphoenolpyruvate carboxykinase [Candidatus Wallbacteria bacterium HGW-Wallbacteria-1]|jgi:phosphoenolpyruvate carboxykinase (ATP)|uniref:phosphoenolpyruvate carboxykinase (ATP) n=1 Tax=Candidatus Wallbacteria bacterium HGW-Wallbacteria-1 TaxID=2013854 RepID=A0A2N1PNX8_9BACT|nr:MAG: phosphoenolpyruvate carboxykinase [Candidatus Wallbacteria bacterium HGW-Wallbacteria-1]
MASRTIIEHFRDLRGISPIRATAETIFNEVHNGRTIHKPSMADLYDLARNCPGVTITDLSVSSEAIREFGLPPGARVLNHNHGRIVGRSASARHFYTRLPENRKSLLEGVAREVAWELSAMDLYTADVVCGLDPGLMVRARMITPAENAINLYNWCLNFMPMQQASSAYESSTPLEIPDILVVSHPEWKDDLNRPEFQNGAVIVDYGCNTIFILGLRYFGEHKKGTLTLAWSSGMSLGRVACHGGIKEVDFSSCASPYRALGKRTISFFGLSGSGKSSHTNSLSNDSTLPENVHVTIAHDDAFQVDCENLRCTVWEPSLFDKTDQRDLLHPDWNHVISTQNQLVLDTAHGRVPVGLDLRNSNGRAIFSRSMLGNCCDSTGFPDHVNWLMKDSTLPPIMRLENTDLAVAMGATLMTKRSSAENVSAQEMTKLVFEPFANPFRVYELFRDCRGFRKVFETGAKCHVFNSGGFWKASDSELTKIPLSLSLKLQTAILTDSIQWEPWKLLPGALIPTIDSIERVWPGYSDHFVHSAISNHEEYLILLNDRIRQRVAFLETELSDCPDELKRLVDALSRSLM